MMRNTPCSAVSARATSALVRQPPPWDDVYHIFCNRPTNSVPGWPDSTTAGIMRISSAEPTLPWWGSLRFSITPRAIPIVVYTISRISYVRQVEGSKRSQWVDRALKPCKATGLGIGDTEIIGDQRAKVEGLVLIRLKL